MTEPVLDPDMVEAINMVNRIIERAINEDRRATLRILRSKRRGFPPGIRQTLLTALIDQLVASWDAGDTEVEVINADDATKVSGEPVPIVPMIDVGEIQTVERGDWVR